MTPPLKKELHFSNAKTPSGSLNPTFIEDLNSAFNLDVFVETGTYLGDSAIVASETFKQVHTIELSDNLYQRAIERFKDNPKIRCYLGDSADVMRKLVPALSGRVLFWLDGHYSGGITSSGKGNTPILSELEAIGLLPSKEAVILIDDLRLFQYPKSGFKTALSLEGYPTVAALKQATQEIFPNHQFIVYGDIAIVLTGGLSLEISPVVEGMTTSRSWDEELGPSNELIKAEQSIISAQGTELCALIDLYHSKKSDLNYGLAGHYFLWYVLTLIGKRDFASARDELQKLIESGLINTQKLEFYNSILTSGSEVSNNIVEKSSSNPPAHNFVTLINRLPSKDVKFIDEFVKKSLLMHGDPLNFRLGCGPQNGIDACTGSQQREVYPAEQPLRLHLGCGEQYLDGYTNIDYPRSEHAVMDVKADLYADIATLKYPDNSVDEIRLHHVFEHFNRVTALALLIRWYEWLKLGGKLVIETPDLEGSAKILLSDLPWQVKTATVRHLAGDQTDTWAYHVDHWFPERFQRTLSRLGFTVIQTTQSNWQHEPYLANVTVVATKNSTLTKDELLTAADSILLESTVSLSETATFSVWQKQLRDFFSDRGPLKISITSADTSFEPPISSHLPIDEIQDFNQRSRDSWVANKAATVPAGVRVLDIGAGTCPYRSMFSHCEYKAHDFKKYTGEKLGGTVQYGNIDYVSEITSIPVADASFDVILCTEVLEHIPEPGLALQEMVRILRPGGRIFLSAPLGSGLHQLPFHYYGGFSPEWYRYWAAKTGLSVVEIDPNGGFFRLLAQECVRAANLLSSCPSLTVEDVNEMRRLLSDKLPRFFFAVEDTLFVDQFTVGYHVELHKPSGLKPPTVETEGAWTPDDRFEKIMRLKQAHLEDLIK